MSLSSALSAASAFGYIPAAGKVWKEIDGSRATPATLDGDLVGEMAEYTGVGPSAKATSAGARAVLRVRGGLRWLEVDGTDDGYTFDPGLLPDSQLTATYFGLTSVASVDVAYQFVLARFKPGGDWGANNWGGFGINYYTPYVEMPVGGAKVAFEGTINRAVDEIRLDEVHVGGGATTGASNGVVATNPGSQLVPDPGSPATTLFWRDHLFGPSRFGGRFFGLAVAPYVAPGTARDDLRAEMGRLANLHLAALSFAPSDISSLVADFNPAINGFQDVGGTTPASSDGDPLRSIKSGSKLAVTSASGPTVTAAFGAGGKFANLGDTYLSVASPGVDRRDFSVHIVLDADHRGNRTGLLELGAGSGEVAYSDRDGKMKAVAGGVTISATAPVPVERAVIGIVSDGSAVTFRQNGSAAGVISGAFASGTPSELDLMGSASQSGDGGTHRLHRAVVCSPRASGSDLTNLEEYLQRTYPPVFPSLTKTALIFHGNSLMAGSGGTTFAVSLRVISVLGSSGYEFRNVALPGQTMTGTSVQPGILTSGLVEVDPYYVAGRPGNWCIAWELRNELVVNGTSGPACYAAYSAYRAARAAVFGPQYVILIDCIKEVSESSDLTARKAYDNAALAAEYTIATGNSRVWQRPGGGFLVQASTLAVLQDPTDATYFSDGLHLTDAGYNPVGDLVAYAIGTTPTPLLTTSARRSRSFRVGSRGVA